MSGAIGSILSNFGALQALNGIAAAQGANTTLETQLSTGLAINSPADNPAGFIAAQGLTSQVNGLTQAASNANEGISLLQTAQGAVGQQEAILQKLNSIAVAAANGTESNAQRTASQNVVTALLGQINTISRQTQYNGINLLDGTFQDKQFQVGANNGQILNLSIGSTQTTALKAVESGSYVSKATGSGSYFNIYNGSAQAALVTTNFYQGANLAISGSKGAASTPPQVSGSGFPTSLSIANSINSISGSTGVTATSALNITLVSSGLSTSHPSDLNIKYYSAAGYVGNFTAAGATSNSQLATLINSKSSVSGLTATLTSSGAINLNGGSAKYTYFLKNAAVGNTYNVVGDSKPYSSFSDAFGTTNKISSAFAPFGTTVSSAFLIGKVTLHSKSNFTYGGASGFPYPYLGLQGTQQVSSATSLADINVSTQSSAQKSIGVIKSALDQLSAMQGYLGASQQRFQDTLNNLMASDTNLHNGLAVIQDANIPQAAQQLTQSQIQAQTGVAALKSSRTLQQEFLSLLP